MESIILLIIGILVIIFSSIFIKKKKEYDYISSEQENNDDELVITLESLENIIDDINITFNNTINEMEERYKLLESKIDQVDIKTGDKNYKSPISNIKNEYNYEKKSSSDIDILSDIEKMDEDAAKRFEKIKDLKNKGLSIPQIAKNLNMGIGEVMLILNLNRK